MRTWCIAITFLLLLMVCNTSALGDAAPANPGDQSVLGDDFVLETQDEIPESGLEKVEYTLDGSAPRPGETPRINSITIEMQAQIRFDSPFAPANARLYNPDTSNMVVVYVLRISVAELQRQAGITGYTAEAYAALSLEEGFDAETSYITLSQTKGIPPGGSVEKITLGALPDGSTLPAGVYTGELVMVPFDKNTTDPAMVNAVVAMLFSVETGVVSLNVDEHYTAVIQLFNPIHADSDIIISIQISQAEIERVSGSPHRTRAELALQAETPKFHPGYEFIPVFTSEPIAPGQFLEMVMLEPLPDGENLPSGTYTGWLVRYDIDAATGDRTMQDVDTR